MFKTVRNTTTLFAFAFQTENKFYHFNAKYLPSSFFPYVSESLFAYFLCVWTFLNQETDNIGVC